MVLIISKCFLLTKQIYNLYLLLSLTYAEIAQLVEHAPEERSVGGSIPSLGTISSTIENITNSKYLFALIKNYY